MEVTVRQANEGDITSIHSLLKELGRPKASDNNEVKIFQKKIKDYFGDSDKSISVAIENSNIIGMVSMIFLQRLNQTRLELYIPELVVTKKDRRQGIGKKLMEYCIQIAKDSNCYRIRLESGNARKESHMFYKNLGFNQSSLSFEKKLQ